MEQFLEDLKNKAINGGRWFFNNVAPVIFGIMILLSGPSLVVFSRIVGQDDVRQYVRTSDRVRLTVKGDIDDYQFEDIDLCIFSADAAIRTVTPRWSFNQIVIDREGYIQEIQAVYANTAGDTCGVVNHFSLEI